MKKFLAGVIAVMMAFTLVLPAMAENDLTAEVLPEAAADLNEALNVPGGTLVFVSEGTYPWVVEEDWAKSTNEGIASSESTVSTTVTVVEGDIVQFDFISAGEGSNPTYDWDNLKFKVDGVEVIHWALHNEWETYAQALEAGEHTLSWTYKKDSSVNPTPDVAKLDNVYVGAPVDPNAINVEDLTVPGNRHAQLVWEVLPAAAFDKSVTFAIADEAIATIDEEGVVTGIAAGETTVTVTSVAVPEVSGTATITVTEALPELTLDSVLNVEGGELHFVSEGTYPWVIPETAPLGQEYAKSSNEGVHSSSSTITAAVTANEGDILQFDFQCWGEGAYSSHWDKLQLKIDGTAIIDWGEGPKEWTTYATALTAGEHNIEWTYSKDASGHKEGDHAFLDNVYVGEPVKPNEIQVDPVEVPAGRHATAVYTVLPEDAFDKSVTFATADEAIATVDENGIVTGVAEGETNLIVTSVADPEVFGTAVITVTEELPTVWLNGYMAYDPQGTSGIWGQFADYDPSVVENKGAMETTFAAAFAGGKVYGYTYDPDAGPGEFYIMDPANGYSVSYPGYNPGIGVFEMAYDHAGFKMYALCDSPNDPDGRALYEVNLAVGSLEYVADLDAGGETIMTLAIATDGTAYGLTYADANFGGGISELYSINLETGVCTLIGSTGLGLAYVQSMTWDHNTNQLFWAQYASDGSSGLYTVDVTTGAATLLGTIGSGAEVTGLFTVDTLAIPPIEMPECAISFMDGMTGEEIEGGYTVEAGSVLDPEDFPVPPEHAGFEFTGWDYDGHAVYTDTVVTALYKDPNAIGYYFETQEDVNMWTMLDSDGDGHNWQWSLADPTHLYSPPEGEGCMISFSYDNDSYSPLYPNNWLISPEVLGGGSVSFKIVGQDPEYAAEVVGVYASADGGATWSDELGYFTATGEIQTLTVSLADFAGMNIKLAFRHYDVTDQFCLNLDAVEVSGGVTEPEPVLPEEITVEDIVVYEGQTADAVYTVLPEEAEDKSVTFAIADETIATVDENGVVTGVAVGETEITVTSVANPEISGTATVTVIPYAPEEGDVIFDIRNPKTEDGLYYALPGETVTVEFTVTGEYAAHGANINFNFDPELLTIESLEEGPVMAEIRQVALPTLDYETVPGSIKLGIMAPTDPFSAQGVIYTVSFKVAETAELDAVLPLEIEIAEFFNMPVGGETTPIPTFAYNSGIVVAAPPTPPTPPTPPPTGFVSLAGAGIAAILAGAGIVLFRKKRS